MTVALEATGLAGLLGLVVLASVRRRPQVAVLARVEDELHQLRSDVVDYRVAHEHLMGVLDRRLDAMEQTTATAMNELRMASGQLMTGAAEMNETGV